ncbi:MAG: hypothetical protein V3R85_03245 [Alphaproteobacteria bacterium]
MNAVAEKYFSSEFDIAEFEPLKRDPTAEIRGAIASASFTARIAIPNYDQRIEHHYRAIAPRGLAKACADADIPFGLARFGLVLHFAEPAELPIHVDDMALNCSVRALVDSFGPVIFRNAYIDGGVRERFHRNIFPHLRFHVDRGPGMPNQYSCFTRDPFDAEQRGPRATSTLFIANIVAWLEMVRAGACDPGAERGVRASYDLFHDADMAALFGDIVLDQPWNAPDGIGEIAVIDNRTVQHASYHKDGRTPGYRIGARYLG